MGQSPVLGDHVVDHGGLLAAGDLQPHLKIGFICIYIYIERERQRERERSYIYIYRERERFVCCVCLMVVGNPPKEIPLRPYPLAWRGTSLRPTFSIAACTLARPPKGGTDFPSRETAKQ